MNDAFSLREGQFNIAKYLIFRKNKRKSGKEPSQLASQVEIIRVLSTLGINFNSSIFLLGQVDI